MCGGNRKPLDDMSARLRLTAGHRFRRMDDGRYIAYGRIDIGSIRIYLFFM